MRHIPFILAALICDLPSFIIAHSSFAAEPAKPNILFILADDWGWGDLSCHGSKVVNTPNLDQFAREGTEFYQFNTCSPVCSPSRTAFMTGQFPARFSVHEAIGGQAKNREVDQVDWVNPQATTLPRLLKSAGYATGHFGKWHLSGPFSDAPLPVAYGFDEHAVWTGPTRAKETDFHKVFDDAIAFMRAHRAGPFYVNLWIHQTHAPQVPSEESLKEYAHLDEQHRPYAAAVADGDKGIGKVLAALKELGIEDRTIVIFASDNGPEKTGAERQKELRGGYDTFYSVGTTGGLRGRKRSLFEGGVHLPFFVRWPGHVPAGKLNKTTALAAVDILPTLCAAVGVKLPAGYQPDGENMLPAWLGAQPMRTQPIFWDWRGVETQPETWPRWSVRDGDWKLVIGKDGRTELLHSTDDWAEASDVSKEHPDLVARLSAKLDAWKATLPKKPDPARISQAKPAGRNTAPKQRGRKAQASEPSASQATPAQRARTFGRWDTNHDGALILLC